MDFPLPEALLSVISIEITIFAAFIFQRQKTSYFRAARQHFIGFFVCVMVMAFSELPFLLMPSAGIAKLELEIILSGIASVGLIIGNAATILKYYPGSESLKDFIFLPWRKPHLPTVIYNSIMIAMGILAWIVPTRTVPLKFPLSGGDSYGVRYENWFLFFPRHRFNCLQSLSSFNFLVFVQKDER